ncbi:hypothetical protein Tco_0783187 [Tanacetum coccineum]
MIQPEPEGSTQGYLLVSVEVLRFYTSAGNPVKDILLKLNLPDHRNIYKDGHGGVQDHIFTYKSKIKEQAEDLKSMITTSIRKLMIEVKDYELKTKVEA